MGIVKFQSYLTNYVELYSLLVVLNQFAKVLEVVGAWEVGDKTYYTPHDDKLFKIDSTVEKLDDNLRKKFHSSVQSCVTFLCSRVAFLEGRVT